MATPSDKYGKVLVILSIIALFISVGAIIWAGSKIDMKAEVGYEFASINKSLPDTVKENIKDIAENYRRIEKFQDSINLLIKVHSKQEDILQRLEALDRRMEKKENIKIGK